MHSSSDTEKMKSRRIDREKTIMVPAGSWLQMGVGDAFARKRLQMLRRRRRIPLSSSPVGVRPGRQHWPGARKPAADGEGSVVGRLVVGSREEFGPITWHEVTTVDGPKTSWVWVATSGGGLRLSIWA